MNVLKINLSNVSGPFPYGFYSTRIWVVDDSGVSHGTPFLNLESSDLDAVIIEMVNDK